MGNHDAGVAMGRMAEALVQRRAPDESALSLLDTICEPYRNCDAEWETPTHQPSDSYTDPEAPLGRLMVEAFAPQGLVDLTRYTNFRTDEDVCDAWWDEVYEPFKQRYEFW